MEKYFFIAFGFIFSFVFIGMGIDHYGQSIKEAEFAKAGLNQCVEKVGNFEQVIWKRECK